MSVLLVLDLGSSSVRCTAFRIDGTAAALHPLPSTMARVKKSSLLPAADGTFDAGEMLGAATEAVDVCLRRLAAEGLAAGHVRKVAIDCFAMSWVGVDVDGVAVTRVFSYAARGKAVSEATLELKDRLRRDGDSEEAVHRRTGCPIHAAYFPAQCVARIASDPELFSAVKTWQTLPAYIVSQWAGRAFVSVGFSEASWTGLLNNEERAWDAKLCRSSGIDVTTLPPVEGATRRHAACTVSPSFQCRWGVPRDVDFLHGIGDGLSATYGARCFDKSRICVTIGTSAAVRTVVPHQTGFTTPPGLFAYRVDCESVLLGGSLTDGGSMFNWLRSLVHGNAHGESSISAIAEVTKTVSLMRPTSHGLVCLPFLSGERATGWQDSARCAFAGITGSTTVPGMIRAGLEAVIYRLADIVDLMRPHLSNDFVIAASGGALEAKANRFWAQMIADVCACPVEVPHSQASATTVEVTSMGTAVAALGQRMSQVFPQKHSVELLYPNKDHMEAYRIGRKKHQLVYAALKPLHNRLLSHSFL